jgi:nitrogen fixation-related uncharacterized protein
MIEIALAIVAVAQSGLLWYVLNSQKEERNKLINAVLAKNAEELANLDVIDKIKPQKKPKIDDAMIPVENLSDDDFKKYVLET